MKQEKKLFNEFWKVGIYRDFFPRISRMYLLF